MDANRNDCKNSTNSQEKQKHNGSYQIWFPFLVLAIILGLDSVANWLNRKSGLRLPFTVLILLFSFVITLLLYLTIADSAETDEFLDDFTWISFSPHDIMLSVLPILIFEAAFRIEAHEFFKYLLHILVLAIASFLAATLATGGAIYVIESKWRHDGNWTIWIALQFGSLVSATDPVAVIALLHDLRAPEDLSLMIEGESLLNDGTAIIFYNIFQTISHSTYKDESCNHHQNIGAEITQKLAMVCVSVLIGYFMAKIAAWLLGRTFRDSTKERGTIIFAVYLTYAFCELSNGSGVLGLVFLGVFLNSHKDRISQEATRDNLKTWELLSYWANGIVFIITGIVGAKTLWQHIYGKNFMTNNLDDFGFAIIVYAIILLIRLLCLFPLKLIFPRRPFNYKISSKYIWVMWWGGLRGAVALLLAMEMSHDACYNLKAVGDRTMVYVGVTVLFSLLIQATTAGKAITYFQLDKVSRYRRKNMESTLNEFDKPRDIAPTILRQQYPELAEANWRAFKDKTQIESPYSMSEEDRKASRMEGSRRGANTAKENGLPLVTTDRYYDNRPTMEAVTFTGPNTCALKLDNRARHAINEETKGEIAHKMHNFMEAALKEAVDIGMLPEDPHKMITALINKDNDLQQLDIDELIDNWKIKPIWTKINEICQSCWTTFHHTFDANHLGQVRQWLFGTGKIRIPYDIIEIVIWSAVIAQLVLVILALSTDSCGAGGEDSDSLAKFELVKAIVCLLYILFYATQICFYYQSPKAYFQNSRRFWAIFDTTFFVFFCYDLIARIYTTRRCFSDEYLLCQHNRNVCRMLLYSELLLVLFLIKIVLIVYLIIGLIVDSITKSINRHIINCLIALNALNMVIERANRKMVQYNTSNYVKERPWVASYIEQLVISNKSKQESLQLERAKLEAEYPQLAVLMKTKCAIFIFLKGLWNRVEEMKEQGEIEESEAEKLLKAIYQRQIETLSIKQSIPHLDFKDAISYISCLQNLPADLIKAIENNRNRRHFKTGEVLMRQDDESDGFYYIHTGTMLFTKHLDGGITVHSAIYAGSVIGEVAFLFKDKRSGDVKALTDCIVYHFPKEIVEHAITNNDELLQSLLRNYCVHRATDLLRTLPEFKIWTKQRIVNLVIEGWPLDMVDDAANYTIDMSRYDRILLMRGSVIDRHGRCFDASRQPQQVPADTFRNAETSQHCLIYVVPKEELLSGSFVSHQELVSKEKSIRERRSIDLHKRHSFDNGQHPPAQPIENKQIYHKKQQHLTVSDSNDDHHHHQHQITESTVIDPKTENFVKTKDIPRKKASLGAGKVAFLVRKDKVAVSDEDNPAETI